MGFQRGRVFEIESITGCNRLRAGTKRQPFAESSKVIGTIAVMVSDKHNYKPWYNFGTN